MKTFDSIKDALQYTVTALVPNRHAYIINIRGPAEIAASKAAAVQVVAQHMVYEDGEVGLTLNLPFDPASGTFSQLVEFLGTSIDDMFDEYKYDGIPCYAMRFETDNELALKVISFILSRVHGYPDLTQFQVEMHDEGVIDDEN